MPNRVDHRLPIQKSLADFTARSLTDAATGLFRELGYSSERRLPIKSVKQFTAQLDPNGSLTRASAH